MSDLEKIWFLKIVDFRQGLPGEIEILADIEQSVSLFDGVGFHGSGLFLVAEDFFWQGRARFRLRCGSGLGSVIGTRCHSENECQCGAFDPEVHARVRCGLGVEGFGEANFIS